MSTLPRIRIYADGGPLLARDGLSVTFYLRHPHARIAQGVMRSLDAYLRAVGPGALSLYAAQDGYWQNLGEPGWAYIMEQLRNPRCANAHLADSVANELSYEFDYHGGTLEPLPWDGDGSQLVSVVSFSLPTEYLVQHGPGRVRELALELAAPLPFCSGHAGLSFNGGISVLVDERRGGDLCFRYPGMDVPDSYLSSYIGTRVKGVHWLNFLGQPVLGELGGAAGLRERLHSPGTTVQELEGERIVVTLGPWPDAGDTEQGRTLPAYRELARVLEPWLFRTESRHAHLEVPERIRRWERRFLDEP
jgi:TseV toxin immunity protein TsiV